jgi:mono/diheme cytochrome c family protein
VRACACVLLLGALLCAGCAASSPRRSAGARLFAADCSVCHTLSGRNDPRHQGGDLRDLHIDPSAFAQFTAEMPVPHPLSAAQRRTLDAYVMALERVRGG